MADNSFTIPTRLPSLNEVIEANRANRYTGAQLKRENENLIRYAIRAAMRRGECYPVTLPAAVEIFFRERTHRRDLDNIYSGAKFILDAMVAEGVIRNDSQRWLRVLTYRFEIAEKDEITVTIMTLEGATK